MAAADDARTPLLVEEGSLRQRSTSSKGVTHTKHTTETETKDEHAPSLPYGGKVYLARRKKPDTPLVRATERVVKKKRKKLQKLLPKPDDGYRWWEIGIVILTLAFALYAYYYFDHLHISVTRGYAALGYSAAQHQIGQRYLHGLGVDKDQHHAMEWFKKAADQGHPHASYNLAVGHLQGIRTDLLSKGDPHRLIRHAASKGVKEAHHALNEICTRGGCE